MAGFMAFNRTKTDANTLYAGASSFHKIPGQTSRHVHFIAYSIVGIFLSTAPRSKSNDNPISYNKL